MREKARIIRTFPEGTALIEITEKPGDCGSCELCSSSAQPRLIALNPVRAEPGDAVEVETRKPGFGGSSLVFLLPLLLFLVSCGLMLFLSQRRGWTGAEPLAAAAGLAVMALYFLLLRLLKPKKPGRNLSRITRILPPLP